MEAPTTATEPIAPTKKKYDQSAYYKKFIEKNAERLNEIHICEVCCQKYKYYSKSRHLKTKRHLDILNKYAPTI